MQDLVQTVILSVILPKHGADYKGTTRRVSLWKRPLSYISLSKIVATDNTLHNLTPLLFLDQI